MSIIKMTKHNESIYNLKNVELPTLSRPIIQPSNFRKTTHKNPETIIQKGTHASIGIELKPPNPQEFLRKNKPPQPRADVIKCEPRLHERRKPPLPPRVNTLPPAAQVQKNFLRQNMQDAIHQAAREPEKRCVFTRYGDSCPLGPLYHRRPGFGKVPAYIGSLKQQESEPGSGSKVTTSQERQERAEEVMGRHADPCGDRQTGPRYVCDVDRREILEGLKHNWAEKMKEFQLLPIITDTIRKIHNKVELEKELKQLEKDIAQIERHPVIYVVDNDPGNISPGT